MILVTGATGRIGGELVKNLLASSEQVRALVRNPEKAAATEGHGVEVVVGDLEKPETLDAALRGVDKAFLISGDNPGIAELHGNFVEAARRADVGHIVRTSILVAMMPDSPLALSKWHREADQRVIDSGIPYTILQPAYFMQNVLMSAASIASDGIVYGAMGDGKIGVIDVRDVADVATVVLTSNKHEGQNVVLTGPEALSMTDIAAKLSTALSKEVKYINVSPDDAKVGMVAMGMSDIIADAWVKLAQMVSMGGAEMVTPMVKEITGREPQSFEQFAKDFASAFKVMA